jgi:hypothetical protein
VEPDVPFDDVEFALVLLAAVPPVVLVAFVVFNVVPPDEFVAIADVASDAVAFVPLAVMLPPVEFEALTASRLDALPSPRSCCEPP